MDPKNYKTIEDFVHSFEKVADIVREQDADCIIAPMFGAVPFIDVLNVIDDEFPNNIVEYIPASSKIYKLKQVLRGSFENLIEAYSSGDHTGEKTRFLSLEEVVSGNSLKRVQKQFDAAKTDYANRKTVKAYGKNTDFRKDAVRDFRDGVAGSIELRSIGIVDSKMQRLGKKMNKEYETLLDNGDVIPVYTPHIVTMDRQDFFPAKYEMMKDRNGRTQMLPMVTHFEVSQEYIDLLVKVAEIIGKDPRAVTMENMGKIKISYEWVPEELRSLY